MDLSDLNPQQRDAIMAPFDRNVCALSGAGTGKTSVLTRRISAMIEAGMKPGRICAVTFTRKAANEMKQRIGDLVHKDAADAVVLSTFHGLGLSLLRGHLETFGFRPNFGILEDGDDEALMKTIIKSCGTEARKFLHEREVTAASLLDEIEFRMNRLKKIPGFSSEIDGAHNAAAFLNDAATHDTVLGYFHRRYQVEKRRNNVADFNDLLYLPLLGMRSYPAFRDAVWGMWDAYLVDECQDMNALQYRLIIEMSNRGAVPVTIVGDDDQSIYSWRGAVQNGMKAFLEHFPDPVLVRMEQNYRCPPDVLRVSNALIRRNGQRIDKALFTDRQTGVKPVHTTFASDMEESKAITAKVLELAKSGVPRDQIAVLYRNNVISREVEKSLIHAGVPYQVTGGVSFFRRAEVANVMAYLRAAVNPDDQVNTVRALRFPKRGVGDQRIMQAVDHVQDTGASFREALLHTATGKQHEAIREFYETLDSIVEDENDARLTLPEIMEAVMERFALREATRAAYVKVDGQEKVEDRINTMDDLVDEARRFDQGFRDQDGYPAPAMIRDFLDHCAITADRIDDAEDRVNLLTIHRAKGLEWRHVFLIGFEDSVIPGIRTDEETVVDETRLEEERRLCYVAFTRAGETLNISSARRRWIHGEKHSMRPSRFLREIPQTMLDESNAKSTTKPRTQQAIPMPGVDDRAKASGTDMSDHPYFSKAAPPPPPRVRQSGRSAPPAPRRSVLGMGRR